MVVASKIAEDLTIAQVSNKILPLYHGDLQVVEDEALMKIIVMSKLLSISTIMQSTSDKANI